MTFLKEECDYLCVLEREREMGDGEGTLQRIVNHFTAKRRL